MSFDDNNLKILSLPLGHTNHHDNWDILARRYGESKSKLVKLKKQVAILFHKIKTIFWFVKNHFGFSWVVMIMIVRFYLCLLDISINLTIQSFLQEDIKNVNQKKVSIMYSEKNWQFTMDWLYSFTSPHVIQRLLQAKKWDLNHTYTQS